MKARPRISQKIILSNKLYKCWIVVFFAFVALTGYGFIVLLGYFNFAGFIENQSLITIRGTPIGHDFIIFYSAGTLARSADPSAIYSAPILHSIQISVVSAKVPAWSYVYPPSLLLLSVPLSFLPYIVSFLVWAGGTVYGYLIIIRHIAPHPITPWLFLGFPGVVFNLNYGQNGCLSSILLGGGILLLERTPFLAGSLLGLLTYKPQLAMLVPIALLAGRYWRALGGFIAGAAALALVSALLFGYGAWLSFFQNLTYTATIWQRIDLWTKMSTVYALCKMQGANYQPAIIFQAIVTLAAMSVLVWTWLRRAPLGLRGSILVLCIPLSTPYLFKYDLALLGIPFAYLGWHFFVRRQRGRQILLMISWISLFYLISKGGSTGISGTLIILGLMLLMVIHEIGKAEDDPPAQTVHPIPEG
jgi:hypothetical protein